MKQKTKDQIKEGLAGCLVYGGIAVSLIAAVFLFLLFRIAFYAGLLATAAWLVGEDPLIGAAIGAGVGVLISIFRSDNSQSVTVNHQRDWYGR